MMISRKSLAIPSLLATDHVNGGVPQIDISMIIQVCPSDGAGFATIYAS
jgi:hypothetical protein